MSNVTIKIDDRQIRQGNLILVNGSFPWMPSDFPPLMPLKGPGSCHEKTIRLQTTAAVILAAIFQAIHSKESIVPVSGYRDFLHQRQIYESSLLEKGVSFTMKYVAMPGCSEHQTGLAIDLGLKQEAVDYICPDFPYEGICEEFRKKALFYGFIERYKTHKEAVTGISAEPWHFRYVGYPHSLIMEEMDLSLEEYIRFLKGFPYEGSHFYYHTGGLKFEIFFADLAEPSELFAQFSSSPAVRRQREIRLDESKAFQISGNNDDGCIFTVWS